MDETEPADPSIELTGSDLRNLVITVIESNSISFPIQHAAPRMKERNVTAPQIVGVLRSGALSTEGFTGGSWRYRAVARGITVIFTFDIDDDGNVLVVVTTWRNNR